MEFVRRRIWLVLLIASLVAFALGTLFVVQGLTKTDWISDAMREEAVTLGLSESAIAQGDVVDSAAEAQHAGDIIREHRRSIAPTYQDLLAGSGGRYDPTNTTQLSYTQALNMENYLYMSVLGFGVAQMAEGVGAFMLVTGLALGGTGLALRRKMS